MHVEQPRIDTWTIALYASSQNEISVFLERYFLFEKDNHLAAWAFLCLVTQALPLVTVVVGSQTSGRDVTVVTATKDAGEPERVDFSLPSDGSPLPPGLPSWANYVKGVIQHYRGKQMSSDYHKNTSWDLL